MRVLLWHVHGGWTDAFVRGDHEYLLPTTPERDGWGLGRGGRDWPNAVEIAPERLADSGVDVVVLQRPQEIDEAERLLGRRPGRDVPAVFLEHNTPKGGAVPNELHPLADQRAIPVVHVTHMNALLWDSGSAPTTVIEHGIVDPGARYTGALPRLGAVINEPVRRGRVTGTDLLPRFAALAPVDVFGMGTELLGGAFGEERPDISGLGDVKPAAMHDALAARRLYLHPMRWTSLGLSLLEAMHLAMPVVVLGATEAFRAVPPEAGAVSSDVTELESAVRRLLDDPDEAARRGRVAREAALARYGLARFLADWDEVLGNAAAAHRGTRRALAGEGRRP
ncbi:glycosyltransferase [Amnibacterium sp. CER49]|uniref:glycosyltransferase n=1 Tax=Amnibacterium sp. CER49 TaxID=3039161 RepID=UPI00244D0AB0|nr:glycosyltransferase [Amnibacterium sp. CER49]MDH2445391.1 glycosyltransferase [Amnibacterium sp. CER49]